MILGTILTPRAERPSLDICYSIPLSPLYNSEIFFQAASKIPASVKKVRKKSNLEKDGRKKGPEVQQSVIKFADIGGNEKTLMVII